MEVDHQIQMHSEEESEHEVELAQQDAKPFSKGEKKRSFHQIMFDRVQVPLPTQSLLA